MSLNKQEYKNLIVKIAMQKKALLGDYEGWHEKNKEDRRFLPKSLKPKLKDLDEEELSYLEMMNGGPLRYHAPKQIKSPIKDIDQLDREEKQWAQTPGGSKDTADKDKYLFRQSPL